MDPWTHGPLELALGLGPDDTWGHIALLPPGRNANVRLWRVANRGSADAKALERRSTTAPWRLPPSLDQMQLLQLRDAETEMGPPY